MRMNFLNDALGRVPEYRAIENAVRQRKTPVAVTGLASIHKANILHTLLSAMSKKALFIAGDEAEATRTLEDLNAMGVTSAFYPLRDFSLRDTEGSSHEYERQRIEALTLLQTGQCTCIVTTIDAALQYVLPPKKLKERTVKLSAGQEISVDEIVRALVRCGYVRADQIDGTGQFARRGGIVDFYSPGGKAPVRVEFWGDEIDTISYFDAETQRRTDQITEVTISPAVEVVPDSMSILAKKLEAHAKTLRGKAAPAAKEVLLREADKLKNDLHIGCMDKYYMFVYETVATLFDYFDTDALLVFSEGSKLKERMRTTLWQWGEDVRGLLAEGVLCRGLDMYTETYEYALKRAEDTASVYMDAFARGSYDTPTKALVNMTVRQLSVWGGSTQLLAEDLTAALHNRHACAVLAGTERAAMNVAADLKAAGLPAGYFESLSAITPGTVAVVAGTLSAGFEYPNAKFTLITHGRMSAGSQPKAKKKDKNSKAVYSLAELTPGDYVVHATHGIGIFEGIHKIDMQGITKDYIKLRYAKNDTLYVPVTQLDLVAKYIGPREDSGVKLHRLGGTEWQKSKARVRAAVKDIAKELIVLYAQRMKQKGFAFPEDNEWQHDFEAHFEYNETDDQLRCINEIKNDMEREAPMDRLLCGDVGFGKTEVALRAAFKCITAGKQCAILVPTTILAWQHYQTVLKRMEGFPVDVELLSRFRTPRQQDEILRKLRRGSIDLIVGTHRLVSKDVQFKDLGLVIIDEEQRFGVQQKERLKDVCKSADILTLSATPIPRTLNMALSGIRDMSVIEEAPHDRHPVQTYVMEYDPGVISDAIKKELRRGGQVYYLHNDVASIERVAAGIRERVPEARIGIGHGKMSEQELSEVWRRLMEHEIDVLVCTTIIETGVDVPNANTLIIDNADRMGLSQLHQLRGRVGRSTRRAYAYFTFTRGKVLSEISQKRLAAIREFTEFGSGFKIAMRDLEIRGAGNILGGEQHGHMESVGYDMYLKLLNEAVAMMKGEAPENPVEECTVDMQVQAHIPESYIDSTALRLDVYRRIADIKTYEDSSDVVDELIDRFGEPPESVYGLIDIALLRNRATQLGITEVKQQANALLLYKDKFDMERVKRLIQGMPNKVMLSAGSRPYISVALGGKAPLTVLEDVLKVLCGDEDAKPPKPATK